MARTFVLSLSNEYLIPVGVVVGDDITDVINLLLQDVTEDEKKDIFAIDENGEGAILATESVVASIQTVIRRTSGTKSPDRITKTLARSGGAFQASMVFRIQEVPFMERTLLAANEVPYDG